MKFSPPPNHENGMDVSVVDNYNGFAVQSPRFDERQQPKQNQQDELIQQRIEFLNELKKGFFDICDRCQIILWIDRTTSLLNSNRELLFFYYDLIRIHYILVKSFVQDKFFGFFHQNLNEFFIQFQQNCLELALKNNGTIANIENWTDCIKKMEEKLHEKMLAINEDEIITMTTIPIALETLLVTSVVFQLDETTVDLLSKIMLIMQNRCDRNLSMNCPDWSRLLIKCTVCAKIFAAIECSDLFTKEIIKQFTLALIDLGMEENQFQRLLVKKAFTFIFQSLVKSVDIFLQLKREISERLIGKLKENFNIDVLYVCIGFFNIKSLPGELVCWIIPVFICECDARIFFLLDRVEELIQKPKLSLIKEYLEEIMIYLFYEYDDINGQRIHKVFEFLAEYCQQNVFPLVVELQKSLAHAFLQRLSKNHSTTLKALSFLFLTAKLEAKNLNVDCILDMDLDFFQKNFEKFCDYLQTFFTTHLYQIDRYLFETNHDMNEKITSIRSFHQILVEILKPSFINRFRVKIFFTIRQLLSKRFQAEDSDDLIKIGMSILDNFILKVDEKFIVNEILSITSLLISIVNQFPIETKKLFEKLLNNFKLPISYYYQLKIIATESDLMVRELSNWLVELINQLLKQLNLYNNDIDSPSSSGIGPDASSSNAHFLDTNNNEKIDVDPEEKLKDRILLLKYLDSENFCAKCRGIYCLLFDLEKMNEHLQQVILKKLFMCLNRDKKLFYQIYSKRPEEYWDLELFLRDFVIDLKIPIHGCSGHAQASTQSASNDKISFQGTVRITLSNFFRAIILKLLHCIKFSTTNEIADLGFKCLGVLGAIDMGFLNFDQPIRTEELANNRDHSRPFIDYCNRNLFEPKKKSFKLLILDILMNMVKSSTRVADYNNASFALQEMLKFFLETSNLRQQNGLLMDVDPQSSINRLTQVSTQYIESYVKKHYGPKDKQAQQIISASQEMEQWNRCDQIRTFLQNEKHEFLDLEQDLSLELRHFSQVLGLSRIRKKDTKKEHNNCQMETFFNNIKPTMSYASFLQRFINMLYHSFIIPHIGKTDHTTNDGMMDTKMSISQEYETMFTQLLSTALQSQYQQQSHSHSGDLPRKEQLLQEFQDLRMKIGQLQTPEKIFLVSVYVIFRNTKLAYVLVPCLISLSLRHGKDELREKFAKNFSTMIQKKFIEQPLMSMTELGHMGGELLCNIYDYLMKWYQSRRLAHSVIINDRSFREHMVKNLDKEFHGIQLLLDSVDLITMAKLAYQSRCYSKTLQYLEQYQNEMKMNSNYSDSKISMENFKKISEQLYLKTYHGLNELDSINGLSLVFHQNQTPYPSIDYLFYENLLDHNRVGQLISGSKLCARLSSSTSNHKTDQQAYFYDVQHKYLDALRNLQQPYVPPPPLPRWMMNNDNEDDEDEDDESRYIIHQHHLVETSWKLNRWDLDSASWLDFPRTANFAAFHQQRMKTNICTASFGYILSALQQEDPESWNDRLLNVRQSFMAPLNAALLTNTLTAYARCYESSMIPIQIFHDIQQFIEMVQKQNENNEDGGEWTKKLHDSILELLNDWRSRNSILKYGPRKQLVLDVQRSMLQLLKSKYSRMLSPNLSNELFRYWNDTIRCSMDGGCIDGAYNALVEAILLAKQMKKPDQSSTDSIKPITNAEHVDFILDEAEVFWIQNKQKTSLHILRNELDEQYSDIQQHCHLETLKNFSQLPLQDLNNLTNALGLKLTKSQMKLMTSGSVGISAGNSSQSSRFSSRHMNQCGRETSSSAVQEFLDSIEQEKLKNYGRLQLRYAQYCEHARHFSSFALIVLYKSVTISCPKWEEAHFQSAMFFRRLYREYQNSGQILGTKTNYSLGKPDEILDVKARVINSLCQSLKFGTFKFARISLPTLLSIWIDLGHESLAYQKRFRSNEQVRSVAIMKDLSKRFAERSTLLIKQLSLAINNAIFFIDLDTLIGNMLHKFEPIAQTISDILIELTLDFPHHMVWQFARSMNSSSGSRSVKSKELIRSAIQKSFEKSDQSQIGAYFECFRIFSKSLEDLAKYKPPKNRNSGDPHHTTGEIFLRRVAPNLIRSLHSEHKFALPCNQFFLPNMLNIERLSQKKDHFLPNLFIEKVLDQAMVMRSLQMPKKITFLLHNGQKRLVLVKHGDDLRRDRAMLNFCNLFNQCHREEIPMKNVEPMSSVESKFDLVTEMKIWARRKQQPLTVQTYFVVPLSDFYGIIEWIPGLCSFKTLVENQYTTGRSKAKKYLTSKSAFMRSVMTSSMTRESRIERFLSIYPNFQPPLFQNWFNEHYADSHSWYVARKNFILSSAVFSMLGYVLGLCDRHAENILLDSATGQVVHVDFNCLFNRGEDFMVPECVPFRLTQNMISAMGTLGYEGLFRATCEDVLLVLRQFRELFANSVTIFLNDPFVDWIESSDSSDIAEKSVFNVEARLFGITSRTNRKLPKGNIMSIAGQVDHVIQEATDLNNLGAMYHGWAAYL